MSLRLAHTEEEVANNLHAFKTIRDTMRTENLDWILEPFNEMKTTLQNQERKFYDSLNNPNIHDLPSFQKEFENICNITFGNIDIDKLSIAYMNTYEPIIMQQITDAINSDPQLHLIMQIRTEAGSITKDELVRALNVAKNIRTRYEPRTNFKDNKFVNRYQMSYDIYTQKITFNIVRQDIELDTQWMKGLAKKLNIDIDLPNFKEFILDELDRNAPNSKYKKYITEEKKYTKNYTLNSSYASLKGFIGEIRTNIILRILAGEMNVVPTGNIRNLLESNQEVGMDTLVKNGNNFIAGFQIKNYDLKGSQVFTFENTMGAGNFIEKRLQLHTFYTDVLELLFATIQFNQIITKDDNYYYNVRESYIPYDEELGSYLENHYNDLKLLFDAHIDNIIKISNPFKANEKNAAIQDIIGPNYFNTFLIIDTTILPTHYIISSLMNLLKSEIGGLNIGSNYLTSTYTFTDRLATGEKWEDFISGKNYTKTSLNEDTGKSKKNKVRKGKDFRAFPEPKNVANTIKVDYNIKLDFGRMISEAIQQASGMGITI